MPAICPDCQVKRFEVIQHSIGDFLHHYILRCPSCSRQYGYVAEKPLKEPAEEVAAEPATPEPVAEAPVAETPAAETPATEPAAS